MNIDEQIYLEHFGVRGMHWGVRNKQRRERNAKETPVQRKARQRRQARKINSIVLGASFVAAIATMSIPANSGIGLRSGVRKPSRLFLDPLYKPIAPPTMPLPPHEKLMKDRKDRAARNASFQETVPGRNAAYTRKLLKEIGGDVI